MQSVFFVFFFRPNKGGDHFDDGQIKTLREIGSIKPISEYDAHFDGVASIPLSFTSDALVLVEIIPIK